MDGTVLVTGATAGIGQELARRLLEQGTRIVVHGRSPQRAAAAVERIGGGEVAVADLASFAQVRALVDDVAGRFGELQGLVNNAGIGYNTAPPRGQWTEDGHEPTWQVNFLSAFLLTMGLQDSLAAGRGRVVHMSSGVHASGSVDLEQPDKPRHASPYAQSKIALVMLAREQGERWRDLGVDVNACSPGWIATKMGGAGGGSLAAGVDTPLWLLTAPELAGTTGRYFTSGTRSDRTRRWRTPTPGGASGTLPSGPSANQTGERPRQRPFARDAPDPSDKGGEEG
jgi:NAD(P)-dependent dehydrogenase (short-subunit alcohol dehydrogenase family)